MGDKQNWKRQWFPIVNNKYWI